MAKKKKSSVLSTGKEASFGAIARLRPSPYLNKCEKDVWNNIVNSLRPEHFCEADRVALETYVRAFCYAGECREKIEQEGAVLIDPKSGRAYKNPWTALLSSQQTVINLLAPKLRVTPSGRLQNTQTRVMFNTGKMGDDEDGVEENETPEREIIR